MPEPQTTFNAKVIRSKNKAGGGFDVAKKAPGSPSTIDEDFNEDQYGNPYLKDPKPQKPANDDRPERSFLKNISARDFFRSTDKSFDITDTSSVGGSLGIKKVKLWGVSWMILGNCAVFYLGQVIFWIISILGFAVEFGAYTVGDFLGFGFVSETLGGWAAAAVPGLSVFTLGWVLASVCAMAQLGIAVFLYGRAGVNPFKGAAMLWFLLIAAWYWLPIIGGFAPWGLYWMWKVITNN